MSVKAWGGGLRSLADMSAKNVSLFLARLKIDPSSGVASFHFKLDLDPDLNPQIHFAK